MDRHSERMQSDRTLTPSLQMLASLVQNALWDVPLSGETFEKATPEDWEETKILARRGGVSALVFHAAMQLPEDLLPSLQLKLRWALEAENTIERFLHQEKTAWKLSAFFHKAGIRMMILKGLGIARHYPQPELRECGDIDIWLFGQSEKGNRLIADSGRDIDTSNPKHSVFSFDGVLIENHRTFLDETLYRVDRRLDNILAGILEEQACICSAEEAAEIYFPAADFNALFLIRHTAMHFTDGISLRHVTDWAMFLYREADHIDRKKVNRILRREKLDKFAGILTAIACYYLGLSPEKAIIPCEPYREEAGKVLADMMREQSARKSRNPLSILAFKARHFTDTQWRYRIIYGRFSFPGRVWMSVKAHILRPETILKTK